jgi:hypothetical protein
MTSRSWRGAGPGEECCRTALRVRSETSSRIARYSEHEAVEVLPILGRPTVAVKPGNGALMVSEAILVRIAESCRTIDDPTFGHLRKSLRLIGALDDFSFETRRDIRQGVASSCPFGRRSGFFQHCAARKASMISPSPRSPLDGAASNRICLQFLGQTVGH